MLSCHAGNQSDDGHTYDGGGPHVFCEHGDEKEKVRFAGKNGVCDVLCDHCHCQDQYCSCYTSNETHACPYDGESGDGESGNGESGDGDGGGDGDA